MPTYEYVCDECGARFEVFQSITAPPRSTCPNGHHAVRRLISGGSGLLFKGSGFYITDYRSKGYAEAAKKETPPAAAKETAKPA